MTFEDRAIPFSGTGSSYSFTNAVFTLSSLILMLFCGLTVAFLAWAGRADAGAERLLLAVSAIGFAIPAILAARTLMIVTDRSLSASKSTNYTGQVKMMIGGIAFGVLVALGCLVVLPSADRPAEDLPLFHKLRSDAKLLFQLEKPESARLVTYSKTAERSEAEFVVDGHTVKVIVVPTSTTVISQGTPSEQNVPSFGERLSTFVTSGGPKP